MLPTNAPDDVAQAFNACTPKQRALALALAHAIDLPLAFSLANGRLSARLGPWSPLL